MGKDAAFNENLIKICPSLFSYPVHKWIDKLIDKWTNKWEQKHNLVGGDKDMMNMIVGG